MAPRSSDTEDTNSLQPKRSILGWVKSRLSDRPDSEHEQHILRISILVAITILLIVNYIDDPTDRESARLLVFAPIFLLTSCVFFAHLLWRPGISVTRRLAALGFDLCFLSLFMNAGGGTTAMWFWTYLFVTFGMGFRFGRQYLLYGTFFSAAGFFFVILTTPYWRDQPELSYGLLASLVILPAYVSTLLKRLEQARAAAEEANQAKGRFLATMSHETRTPLNGIIGTADLLATSSLTITQREMVQTINASADALLAQISDILDFSKIESGKIALRVDEFDLYRLVAQISSMVMPQAHGKGLRFSIHIAANAPQWISADIDRLRQILLNLVTNAIKYTDTGSVLVTVEPITEVGSPQTVRITVFDTGMGIPEDMHEKVFESFMQTDAAMTRRFDGVGLGLAIVKQLVDLMGGSIGVDSEVGVGSTFWVELPLEQRSVPDGTSAAPSFGPDVEVAVVTDDRAFGDELSATLREWGIEPILSASLASAEMALADASKGQSLHTVALIDDEFATTSREIGASGETADNRAGWHHVLLSGSWRDLPKDQDFRSRFAAVLAKPVKSAELAAVLETICPGDIRKTSVDVDGVAERSRGLRVLVAEDNKVNRTVAAKILERGGHKAELVENGEQALEALTQGDFDIALLDVNMPVMSGIEAVKLYQFGVDENDRTPIVALTADATTETRQICKDAGFDGYLTKPIRAVQLLDMVAATARVREDRRADGASDDRRALEEFEELPQNVAVHPATQQPRGKIVDASLLEELRELGGGDEFLVGLLHDYLDDAARLVDEIEIAVEGHNLEAFDTAVHTLRSASANVGAVEVFQICLDWISMDATRLETEISGSIGDLRQKFDRVRAAYSPYFATGEDRLAEPG